MTLPLETEEPAITDIVFKMPRLGTDEVVWSSTISDITSLLLIDLSNAFSCGPEAELLRHWKL